MNRRGNDGAAKITKKSAALATDPYVTQTFTNNQDTRGTPRVFCFPNTPCSLPLLLASKLPPNFWVQTKRVPLGIARVIAVATASQKGGVGKNHAVRESCLLSCQERMEHAAVDTDPQGAVGLSLARSTRDKRRLLRLHHLRPRSARHRPAHPPARAEHRTRRTIRHVHETRPRQRLCGCIAAHSRSLRAAELRGIDCVLLDTAAGLGGLTEMVVKASD